MLKNIRFAFEISVVYVIRNINISGYRSLSQSLGDAVFEFAVVENAGFAVEISTQLIYFYLLAICHNYRDINWPNSGG